MLFQGMTLADWLTVALAGWAGVKVWLGRPGRIVARSRRKHLAEVVADRHTLDARVAVVLSGATPTAADELSWLADSLGVEGGLGLPFAVDAQRADEIAQGYADYAARLGRGVLLGQTNVPLVEEEARLCTDVVRVLRASGGRRPMPAGEQTLSVPHRAMTLTLHGGGATTGTAEFAPRDLHVSYRRHRVTVFPDTGIDPFRTLEQQPLTDIPHDERRALAHEVATGHLFDGCLPRLTGWRMERDSGSGREVLHLSVAECTYAAVVADHYPLKLTSEPPRGVTGARVGLLTLSAVPFTRCGHLVFARRSAHAGSHPHLLGPAVNGNLEFLPRLGVSSDTGADGVPDPLRALAREGREELGLDLTSSDLTTTGLGTFTVAAEVNTHVLLAVAALDIDFDELPAQMRRADLVEGAWEVGSEIVGLRLPRTEAELETTIEWLVGSPELTPHGTLAGLGALAALGNVSDVFARACRSAGVNSPIGMPTALIRRVDFIERPGQG